MSGVERTNQYGIVPTETKKCLTGLELLTRIMNGTLPAPPIQRTLDFRLIKVDRGSTVFAGIPKVRFLQSSRLCPWRIHRGAARFLHGVCGSFDA
jgi:hypothetical protein